MLTFLYVARGSAGEVRSMLCLLGFLRSEIDHLRLEKPGEGISKQLGAWIQSVLKSGMKGQRYQTDKMRRASDARWQREDFLQTLDRIRKGDVTPLES